MARLLTGRVAAGLGQREAARRHLEAVLGLYSKQRAAYSAALVSIELAILYLETGRAAQVAALAEQMIWIFASKRVHREALAALRLFLDSAQSGGANVEMAREVFVFLENARRNLSLRFESPT